MEKNSKLLKKLMLAMLVAMGVVISPILRIEGMCPMAHFINIVCSVLLGPWYSLLCATLIGVIRMSFMGIPPLALTGAVFGAALSGILYRLSKGKIIFAVIGEVIGTGVIGAIASYPIMTYIWGRSGLTWMFYVPSFIMGTLIGGTIALIFLLALRKTGMLSKIQRSLGAKVYDKSKNNSSRSATNKAGC
ncbi:ThiW protein [Clostridium botulinum C str. Eklund]|nr:ThiW protein [Clostridium botulinum C str. Eklund]NEZ48493.1 energy coupling factor transporter S component ThiW [Clostridium botulinum]